MPIFNSSSRIKGAPGYPERSGERVEIIRPLSETEADLAEVGPMYRVRFADGMEADVFADELTED
jgi:hypothetical protein